MASSSFKLEIVTPGGQLFHGEADIVIVRTTQGYEGFMAKHAWACKLLGTGELLLKEAGSSEFLVAAASKGFIDVKDSVTVFAEVAEWKDDIDEDRAKAAKELAENWLAENKDAEDADIKEDYQAALARANNRIKVKAGGAIAK